MEKINSILIAILFCVGSTEIKASKGKYIPKLKTIPEKSVSFSDSNDQLLYDRTSPTNTPINSETVPQSTKSSNLGYTKKLSLNNKQEINLMNEENLDYNNQQDKITSSRANLSNKEKLNLLQEEFTIIDNEINNTKDIRGYEQLKRDLQQRTDEINSLKSSQDQPTQAELQPIRAAVKKVEIQPALDLNIKLKDLNNELLSLNDELNFLLDPIQTPNPRRIADVKNKISRLQNEQLTPAESQPIRAAVKKVEIQPAHDENTPANQEQPIAESNQVRIDMGSAVINIPNYSDNEFKQPISKAVLDIINSGDSVEIINKNLTNLLMKNPNNGTIINDIMRLPENNKTLISATNEARNIISIMNDKSITLAQKQATLKEEFAKVKNYYNTQAKIKNMPEISQLYTDAITEITFNQSEKLTPSNLQTSAIQEPLKITQEEAQRRRIAEANNQTPRLQNNNRENHAELMKKITIENDVNNIINDTSISNDQKINKINLIKNNSPAFKSSEYQNDLNTTLDSSIQKLEKSLDLAKQKFGLKIDNTLENRIKLLQFDVEDLQIQHNEAFEIYNDEQTFTNLKPIMSIAFTILVKKGSIAAKSIGLTIANLFKDAGIKPSKKDLNSLTKEADATKPDTNASPKQKATWIINITNKITNMIVDYRFPRAKIIEMNADFFTAFPHSAGRIKNIIQNGKITEVYDQEFFDNGDSISYTLDNITISVDSDPESRRIMTIADSNNPQKNLFFFSTDNYKSHSLIKPSQLTDLLNSIDTATSQETYYTV